MARDIESIDLPDGRRLDVRCSGPTDALAVFFHHDSPGSATRLRVFEESAHRHGLRFLTMSRPGYGDSTPHPGRRVVDVVGDTRSVLDHFGVERCLVVGVSGGAPYALACGARLTRCSSVAIFSGVGPVDLMGRRRFAGQMKFKAALLDVMHLRIDANEALREDVRELLAPRWNDTTFTPQGFIEYAATRLSPADRAVIDNAYAEDLVANIHEAIRRSLDGLVDDEIAVTFRFVDLASLFVDPQDELYMLPSWGFRLSEIAVPVSVWRGTADKTIPISHTRWLAENIADASLHVEKGEGHFSITVRAIDRALEEMIGQLT